MVVVILSATGDGLCDGGDDRGHRCDDPAQPGHCVLAAVLDATVVKVTVRVHSRVLEGYPSPRQLRHEVIVVVTIP